MSFTTGRGTRGARQPGRSVRWINHLTTWVIRRRRGRLFGSDALLLTTVGRRTGEARTTPVNWFPDADGGWLIVASAAGAASNPAWYFNIAAHPDQVRIEIAGRRTNVIAEQLAGSERDQAWKKITGTMPRFAQYENLTDRELPVIRLTERGPEPSK